MKPRRCKLATVLAVVRLIPSQVCGLSIHSDKADHGVQFVRFSSTVFSRSGGQADLFRAVIDNSDYVIKTFKPHVHIDSIEPEIFGVRLADECPDSLLKAVSWDFGNMTNNTDMVTRVRLALSSSDKTRSILMHAYDQSQEQYQNKNVPVRDQWLDRVPIVILPFYKAGCLETVIYDRVVKQTDPDVPLFSIDEIAQVFCDIVIALDAFERYDYQHNDVKCGNILLKTDADTGVITKAILCDPGERHVYTQGFVNPEWELRNDNGVRNSAAERDDVFSMCVVLGGIFSVDTFDGLLEYSAESPTPLLFWRRCVVCEQGYRSAETIRKDMACAMTNIEKSANQRVAYGEDENKVQAFANILTCMAASKPSKEKMDDAREMLAKWRDGRYHEITGCSSSGCVVL